MALYTVVSGNVAAAADLNQIVNALNGTDTTTQITVGNRIRAQMANATATSGYVGGRASGAPTTGTWALGDYVIDQTGVLWICTTAGTPGTWWPPIKGINWKARAHSGAQTGFQGWTQISLLSIDFDPSSSFTFSTYVCPVAGYYHVIGQVSRVATGTNSYIGCGVAINGFITASTYVTALTGSTMAVQATDIMHASAGDFISLWGTQGDVAGQNTYIGDARCPFLAVHWLSG